MAVVDVVGVSASRAPGSQVRLEKVTTRSIVATSIIISLAILRIDIVVAHVIILSHLSSKIVID
jgi:hypothetical protein